MPSLSTVRAVNKAFTPNYNPVAVFVGGTSGIGQGMAEKFARYTQDMNPRIVIVGRNKAAAESIISSFPQPPTSSTATPLHEFVSCDATLMKNVHTVSKDLLNRLPKINFLILSPGFVSTEGRNETEEGIDKGLALRYYARWKFIHDLMPLLRKAKDLGEDAKVLTVLGAGTGEPIDLDDLGLKKKFGFIKTMTVMPTYNDLMLESFSAQQPDIAFTHIYPGLVLTPVLWAQGHWAWRPLNALVYVLMYPFTISAEKCAEYMWYAVFSGNRGVFRRSNTGDDIGQKNLHSTDEAREALWKHTEEATNVADRLR